MQVYAYKLWQGKDKQITINKLDLRCVNLYYSHADLVFREKDGKGEMVLHFDDGEELKDFLYKILLNLVERVMD